MADHKLKPLVIKVDPSTEPAGLKYKWDKIPQIEKFTKGIQIPEIDIDQEGNSSVNIGSIVSGMPTVFSRANLFRNALDSVTDKAAQTAGLLSFYRSLLNEWRGLIACIALNYKDITIERIHLAYSDGKPASETANIYEPVGAFGNVLFERKPLWCDQTLAANAEKVPFIDIIIFNNEVVGATSPESFLFTSVSYNVREGYPFVNVRNGKFTDPLYSDLQKTELEQLYGYAGHILQNINKFERNFESLDTLRPDYSNLYGNLQSWLREMEAYAQRKGFKIEAQIPEIERFQSPFNVLFNHATELYGNEGIIDSEQSAEGAIAFDPKNLLLPETSEIAVIDFGIDAARQPDFLKKKPVFLLQADTVGEKGFSTYFALPLTPLALNIFGKNIGSLVGQQSIDSSSEVRSRLYGEYDPQEEKLTVSLVLVTRAQREINRKCVYKVGRELKGQDLLVWPNFISRKWNRYFLYSELPHNDSGYQAVPFVGNMEDKLFRIVMKENGQPAYLAEQGIVPKLPADVTARLHVVSNNAVADIKYKYEIYESDQPFKGVKLSYANNDCGFVMIRYSSGVDAPIHNKLAETIILADADLGIDFGSTNTSVAYYSRSRNEVCAELKFRNRRVSLLSDDNKNNN
ncbi:MAG: hypothetical protein EOP84_13280, partial [Verrucomicrobiaceae bacterium]